MKSRRFLPGIALLLVLFTCCTKTNYIYQDEFDNPSISPVSLTNVEFTSVLLTSNVISDGGLPINERGFFYSSGRFTSNCPEVATKVVSGKGKGDFSVELSGLVSGRDYWACAYAKCDGGETVYSDVVQFKTGESPSVTITGVKKSDYLCWYEFDSTNTDRYAIHLNTSLDVRCVSQIEKIGLKSKVIDSGWEDSDCIYSTWSDFPENDGISTIDFFLSFDKSGTLELTPFIELKDGTTHEFTPYNIIVEAGNVKSDIIIEPDYVQWYSDSSWNYYTHYLHIKQTLYSGAENVSGIGFELKYGSPSQDYNYVYNNIAISDTLTTSLQLYHSSKSSTLYLYSTGKLFLRNLEQQYLEVYGSQNTIYYSFDLSPGMEWFFCEDFSSEKCHFSSDGWIIADSVAVASSTDTCEYRLTSDELDLTLRSNAMLGFYSKIGPNNAGIAERHAVFVSDDDGTNWTELKIENLETDPRDGEERYYQADLATYLGKRIKLAFVYYGGGAWTIPLLAVGTDHSENTTKSISNEKTISRVRHLSREGRDNGIVRTEERPF